MWSAERQERLRAEAMAWLAARTRDGLDSMASEEIGEFTFDGERFPQHRHELGVAAVRNGLALCKIHHAAYDTGILGLRPDLLVQIREDILAETDGPLLEHGLKRLHGQTLRKLPSSRQERPDGRLLAIRYERFLARSIGLTG